jgi:indolepyruvate ferredoxin oxidoreductase
LLIGCDMVTSAGGEALGKLHEGETRAVVNRQRTMTAEFTQNPDQEFPEAAFTEAIAAASDAGRCHFVEATRLAAALLGDSIATNVFMIGYAYQKGYLPLSGQSLEAAIELNGVAVDFNKLAFTWGRRAAHDLSAVEKIAAPRDAVPDDPRDFVQRRMDDLTNYQDATYARRYGELVTRVREAEQQKVAGMSGLADAVAQSYFKLLAIKDEYEVARLFTDGRFEARLRDSFQDGWKLTFHLAPPILSERDPVTGHLVKREFGSWMMTAFKFLARLKGLRGTAFDPFGRSPERRAERQLITDYEAAMETVLAGLTPKNHATATEIAALPLQIRGFGHVKEAAMKAARTCRDGLMVEFSGGGRGTGREAAE